MDKTSILISITLSFNIIAFGPTQPSEATLANTQISCHGRPKIDVLPGVGWDSLRNKDMGQVTSVTYNQCKTTPDGKFVIPDNAFSIPLKESDVQLFSEVIDQWNNYTSITSQSFNLDVGYGKIISGSFSTDYQHTKQRQVDEKSTTFRVHARYTMYAIRTVPTSKLDQQIESLFQNAIHAIEHNNTMQSDMILELIVRNYGTHLITRMDAGGVIMKEDFVKRKFVNSYSSSISEIKASASAIFFNIFGFNASYKQSTSETSIDGYKKSITSSHISTFGGSLFKPGQSVNDWIDSIEKNMVAIDRCGDPLQYVITPYAFPNVSMKTIGTLRTKLTDAILRYYSYNKHIGCMDMDSPNFDFYANVDSHVCLQPTNNYVFGGVFQICQTINIYGQIITNGQFCNGLTLKNPLTGDYSCPENYESILIKIALYPHEWVYKRTINAYWCADVHGNVRNNTGVMFGGVYTSKMDNSITQSGSCPPTYFDLVILNDLHVCVSDDYELGKKFSLDFGGFFSCQSGNPLYNNLAKKSKSLFKMNSNSNSNDYVLACPKGYSQHTAIIDQDCIVNYCVLSGSFAEHGNMPIVLPPFRSFHALFDGPLKDLITDKPNNEDHGRKMSASEIVLIVIGCFTFLVILIGSFIIWLKKRRNSDSTSVYIPINSRDYNTDNI